LTHLDARRGTIANTRRFLHFSLRYNEASLDFYLAAQTLFDLGEEEQLEEAQRLMDMYRGRVESIEHEAFRRYFLDARREAARRFHLVKA